MAATGLTRYYRQLASETLGPPTQPNCPHCSVCNQPLSLSHPLPYEDQVLRRALAELSQIVRKSHTCWSECSLKRSLHDALSLPLLVIYSIYLILWSIPAIVSALCSCSCQSCTTGRQRHLRRLSSPVTRIIAACLGRRWTPIIDPLPDPAATEPTCTQRICDYCVEEATAEPSTAAAATQNADCWMPLPPVLAVNNPGSWLPPPITPTAEDVDSWLPDTPPPAYVLTAR